MSDFGDILADAAADILADQGEPVDYQAGDAEAVTVQAVATRFGMGPCPAGWPADLFPHSARHAEFRLACADVPDQPTAQDTITVDGLDYEVRSVGREPETGPDVLWWICRGAASQRGRF